VKNAFGKLNLVVSTPVENESETLGLMEANYRMMNIISYEVIAVDCKGNRHKITVHDGDALFDEIIE
jgi:hypothetical protein